jgi:hypothetical protein
MGWPMQRAWFGGNYWARAYASHYSKNGTTLKWRSRYKLRG